MARRSVPYRPAHSAHGALYWNVFMWPKRVTYGLSRASRSGRHRATRAGHARAAATLGSARATRTPPPPPPPPPQDADAGVWWIRDGRALPLLDDGLEEWAARTEIAPRARDNPVVDAI
jgi:hypothetical protein